MKFFLLFVLSLFLITTSQIAVAQSIQNEPLQGAIYTLDQNHSLMDFTVRHAGFGRVRGTFNEYRASMYFVEGALESSSVSAVIDVKTLDTQNEGRDEHLREVFFQASKYPHIRFQSTKIEKTGSNYVMFGKLTIKDVTRTVRLPLDILTLNGLDQWENKRIVLETSLSINRRDYNVVYDNEFWDAVVGDEIKIDISFGASYYNARNTIFPWRKNSIGTLIKNGVAEDGIEATLKKARQLKAAQSEDYKFGISHFYRAGLTMAQGGQAEEGIKVLELALELHKDSAEAADLSDLYAAIGQIYAHDSQMDKAMSALEAALKADPLNPTAIELKRNLVGNTK